MNTFLILINLASPAQAKDVANFYRTVPELSGWKGRVCIEQVCEDIDRSSEMRLRVRVKETDSNEIEETKELGSKPVYPMVPPPSKDPIDKVFSGLGKLMDKNAEFNVKVEVDHKKSADGSEETHVKVEVGGKVGTGGN